MDFGKHCSHFANPADNLNFKKEIYGFTENENDVDLREMLLEYTKEEGREEGRVENATAVVKNLIVDLDLPDEQIASVVGVSIDFVSQVRNKLGK